MFNQGEIILIPVPFTDLSSHKRRPVIVISNDAYNASTQDILVVAMTSSIASNAISFTIDSADLETGILNRPGQIRVDKIYSLAQNIVTKRFAKVNPMILVKIKEMICKLISI